MTYLYGDSSGSSLESNFIQFLGDALEFSVHSLLASQRMRCHSERIEALRSAASAEIGRLETLGRAVTTAVGAAPKGEPDSATAGCAATVLTTVAEAVGKHVAEVRAVLARDLAAVEAEDAKERQGCLTALEALLRQHDPPTATVSLNFVAQGARYAARLAAQTKFGLEWILELDIAAPHLLSQIARIDKFAPQLEIQAPESGGWIRKEVKNRPQRLDKYYLSELSLTPEMTTLKLRANAEGQTPGFDVEVRNAEPRLHAVRIGDTPEGPTPFEISEEDAAKLLALHDKLVASAREAAQVRTRLLEAKVDGVAFLDVRDPTELVERLIGAMAPIAREIAQHSRTPDELVLKRVLGDNRREEIFVSKAALNEKLAPLTESQRAKFKPLGLGGASMTPPPLPSVVVSAPDAPDAPDARVASTPSVAPAR